MARDFNENRNVNAILGQATIDKYGNTFAVHFGLDGINIANVTVKPMPDSIIPYLEGDISIKQYAVPINVDELCDYALASFPNIEELTLFSLDIVSVEDHLSYLSKLKIMYVNQNNLSGYSWFPTTIHSGYESFTSVDDYIGYVVVYNALPYIVNENNKNDLEIVAGTTIAYDKYLTNIAVDYTYEIKDYTQEHILTSEIINEQLNALTSQQRNAITKLVITSSYTSASVNNVLWGYNFGTLLPYLNNNIWYNGVKFDFSEYTIQDNTQDHILTASVVSASINAISPSVITAIEKIIVPVSFTSYASGSITELQAFMNTNSIDKLETCYEAGEMELSLNGDIVAKIVSIGKTLDEALVYAKTIETNNLRDLDLVDLSKLIIIPPINFSLNKAYPSTSPMLVAIIKSQISLGYYGNGMKNATNLIKYDANITGNNVSLNLYFDGLTSLKYVNMYFTNGIGYSLNFYQYRGCSNIETITTNTTYSTDISSSTKLTRQALIDLFNSLGTPSTQQTLTIGATNLAKLQPQDIQILYNKNWYLSPTPSAFTFTIGSDTYSCDFGMTWEQWCDSAYNTAGFVIVADMIFDSSKTNIVAGQIPTDMIKYGTEYTLVTTNVKYCQIDNLGSQNPSNVTFTKSANFPNESQAYEQVIKDGNYFAKYNKWYKKVVYDNNNYVKSIIISDTKINNDFHLYDCFIDEDDNELDYILIGQFPFSSTTEANSIDATSQQMALGTARELAIAKGNNYQIFDTSMFMLWRDLVIAVSERIKFNDGSNISSYLGLSRLTENGIWIDGITESEGNIYYSSKPSKYINNATGSSDGYSTLGYTVPTSSGNGKVVKELGYDSNKPTINLPILTTGDTNQNEYYCNQYWWQTGSKPLQVYMANGLFYAAFYSNFSQYGVARLCYRPIGE